MENIKDRRLRLWKARQTAEGHDVSGVKTLEEAERFFEKKEQTPSQSRLAPCQLSQRESLFLFFDSAFDGKFQLRCFATDAYQNRLAGNIIQCNGLLATHRHMAVILVIYQNNDFCVTRG